MVTLPVPERLAFVKRSVEAYCAQTYADKELVIVTDGSPHGRQPLAAYVSALGREDVRFVPYEGTLSLGALRNRAREAAGGDYLCQWDDDDLYHPCRIDEQLQSLLASDGICVYLEDVMQYVVVTHRLYWTNWRLTQLGVHPGTMLCARNALPVYPEDRPVPDDDSVVCQMLRQHPGFVALAGKPYLYVYVSHGANTYPDEHHAMLARELAISRGLLLRRENDLRAGLATFDFGDDEIAVYGSNGPAFTLATTVSS